MASGHGGKRSGAGRKPGVKNKATSEELGTLTEMAQSHAPEAVAALASIMNDEEHPPSARVAAANSILDRGYGKPSQAIDHSSEDGTMTPITGFNLRIVDASDVHSDEASS